MWAQIGTTISVLLFFGGLAIAGAFVSQIDWHDKTRRSVNLKRGNADQA